MKHAVDMGSVVMIYITKFQKDWFNRSKVHSVDTLTYRQHGDCMILHLFLENKERRLIK
jgi:hypothetical protein